ncbi:hypothetical protein ABVK25_011653 [Lepraria finkii]|uniref:Uncharacterized protein n=1 Tax=Lepraria finkii TaxID=1340010 RepID=A0ABR4API1_9LECA
MFGQLFDRVSDCVATVCSAYQEGFIGIQNIRAKRKQLESSPQELEGSLTHGETAVKDQYEKSRRRYGEASALGDQVARNALHEITTHLNSKPERPLAAGRLS